MTGRAGVSLDFKAACAHQCPGLNKKQRAKEKWSADQFVFDTKAANVTRKLLVALGAEESDRYSLHILDGLDDNILCKSCSGHIRMDFNTLQSHAHRHEDMNIAFYDAVHNVHEDPLVRAIPGPVEHGLCAELQGHSASAPRKRAMAIYGCRHCYVPSKDGLAYDVPGPSQSTRAVVAPETIQSPIVVTYKSGSDSISLAPAEPGAVLKPGAGKKASKKGQTANKLMIFDGLKCHLKERHRIEAVSDEDVYRVCKGDDAGKKAQVKPEPVDE